ncbi:aerolysin-like protein [Tachysurus fulvidraco]|uniref:aerolysin-like protein n=1 Tax=Tachysurus fulvidraco TaxID=1234273 RepID=UPI001FEDF3A6|nr:aerolysin-like protein [Tachysurus fulvidraco]
MATSIVQVGGRGGQPFTFTGKETGSWLQKIQVWEGDSQIKAVKVWLTDNEPKEFGVPDGSPKEFTFEKDEKFTSLSLWPNKDDTHLGAIKFTTSSFREFHAKVRLTQLQPEVQVDVETGKCIGIQGRYGTGIDRFGFTLLKKKSA